MYFKSFSISLTLKAFCPIIMRFHESSMKGGPGPSSTKLGRKRRPKDTIATNTNLNDRLKLHAHISNIPVHKENI